MIISGHSCSLSWQSRMKIAIGAAKGLAFLHGEEKPVIYRDFKTSNILLDAVIPSASYVVHMHPLFKILTVHISFTRITMQSFLISG